MKTKQTLHTLLSFALLAAPLLAANAKNPPKPAAKQVLVDAFANKSRLPDTTVTTLRDRIVNEVVASGKFRVSDRKAMRNREREIEMADMGLSDGKGVPEDGHIRSAGYQISGTLLSFHFIQPRSARMELQIEIIDLDTQEILSSRKIDALLPSDAEFSTKAQMLDGCLAVAAREVVFSLVDCDTPAKILAVRGDDITVNLKDSQVKIGDLFDVFASGEELFDPDTGESLGADETKVGRIRVVRPGPKFSKVETVRGTHSSSLEKGMILRRAAVAFGDATQVGGDMDLGGTLDEDVPPPVSTIRPVPAARTTQLPPRGSKTAPRRRPASRPYSPADDYDADDDDSSNDFGF